MVSRNGGCCGDGASPDLTQLLNHETSVAAAVRQEGSFAHILILIGLALLALGVGLCVPAGLMVWQVVSASSSGATNIHVDFVLSSAAFTLGGAQAWAFVIGLVIIGILLSMVGLHLISSRHE